jgi:hypothetical protein
MACLQQQSNAVDPNPGVTVAAVFPLDVLLLLLLVLMLPAPAAATIHVVQVHWLALVRHSLLVT